MTDKSFMKVLILLLFFSLKTSFAQECGTTLVSTENMPKNNYTDASWCLFWANADLLSFHEGTALSSYDIALQYFNTDVIRTNQPIPDNVMDTGGSLTASLILATQSSKGICTEAQTNFADGYWPGLATVFSHLVSPKKTLIQVVCENNYENMYPFKDIPSDVLKIVSKLSNDKKAAALLDVTCPRYKLKNKYGVGNRSIDKTTDDKVMAKLDELLDKKEPAIASYDLTFVEIKDLNYTRNMEEGYIAHAATIIGRQMNPKTNKCEYLIRASAGNRCPKNTAFECDRSTGLMWVPKENLQKNIYDVTWLTKR